MTTGKGKLELFEHNQRAFRAACSMMEREGCAAVIHPTGTGKSFIAFALAQEHPQARILWLSPSAYIFRTQAEELKKQAGKEAGEAILSGITFMTYSRLLMAGRRQIQEENPEVMSDRRLQMPEGAAAESTEEMVPDYIVLDEFHRCGAAEWEKGVRRLLGQHPQAKVLGLSATAVRYLDGQRDMAQELFGGHVASEMTLGEAIARGILPMPEYVAAIYSYREELERLSGRIREFRIRREAPTQGIASGSPEQRDAGQRKNGRQEARTADVPIAAAESEELLEELRRALEQAEGPKEIFGKYLRPAGRYIVFCSGREQMEEMIGKAPEWFAGVDAEPHIYRAYYNNPQTEREFTLFKEDKSAHLRLLYCIDMLNEGVHVDGIDGVILLRPTVSPIIYFQQIGRALSASGREEETAGSQIFDLVNNFDSLYTIDTLRKEIWEAFDGLPDARERRERFAGCFRISAQLRKCRELFARLGSSLSAGWERYYAEAAAYYGKKGNLRIPMNYRTAGGLNLGAWLQTQRRIRKGRLPGRLTEEQAARLDAIGMEWEDGPERKWRRGCEELAAYREEYGDADVGASYVAPDGYPLGKWVSNLRSKWSRGELTQEQKEQAEALGMIWDKRGYRWEVNYRNAEAYWREHGNLEAPKSYRAADGSGLGVWLDNQRQTYAGTKKNAAPLSERQIRRLEAIGMRWVYTKSTG